MVKVDSPIADDIHSAPYGRTEDEWIDVANELVTRLSELTGCFLEMGRYDGSGDAAGNPCLSFGVRVRSKQGLPGVKSDYWEAAICVDRDERGAWADVYAFPFLNGSAVTPMGRIADRGPQAEIDRLWLFQWANGQWVSRGWDYPDGPGEWGWIKKPGDDYEACLPCHPTAVEFRIGEPILVAVELGDLSIGPPFQPADPEAAVARVSPVSVNRDREQTNLVPWSKSPPKSSSPHVQRFVRSHDEARNAIHVPLDWWRIRGDWISGKYTVRLRLQFRDRDSGDFMSRVSEPFKVRIVDS